MASCEPTHSMREMKDTSLMSWSGCTWKEICLHLLPQAVGADDTTLIERVEPTSFGAAGGRLLVPLTSSKNTARPGNTWTSTQSSNVQ